MVVKKLLSSIGRKIQRRLIIKKSDLTDTPLNRCLSLPEIVFMGMSLLLNGIFVTIPTVVRDYAGPGIVYSFLLAGIAAVLSAFSYAEMGSRVPRAGSGYVFVSVSLGELWGFLTGWNMLFEYALMCAAMSRSITSTLFVIIDSPNVTSTIEDINFRIGGQQTDVIAACIVLVFAVVSALGVKLTSILNAVLNFTSVGITLGICVFSFLDGDIRNWTGDHSFLPYGFGGILAGGSVCYFSYIGFEAITVVSEETKDPSKTIPLAIGIVFVIMSFLFILCSLAFTYYAPYLAFVPNLPIAQIMLERGANVASVLIGVAGIMGVITNIVVCLNSIPRITYAMASDGLLWPCFQRIHPSTQTPLIGMVFAGLFVAVVTFFFELPVLMSAVSLGTLFSYVLVSLGAIYLRFMSNEPQTTYAQLSDLQADNEESPIQGNVSTKSGHIESHRPGTRKLWLKEYKYSLSYWPDVRPGLALAAMTVFMIIFSILIAVALRTSTILSAWCICISLSLLMIIIICIVHLSFYEQDIPKQGTFRIPAMPLIPALSVLMNLIFMMMLSYFTWIRLVVWVAVGLLIYFTYSIHHSTNEEQVSFSQPVQHHGAADYGTSTGGT